MLSNFGWIGTKLYQTSGNPERLGICAPVAERASIGGETRIEAGGGGGGNFPTGHFEKPEKDPGGRRDFGNDKVESPKAWVADVVIDDDIHPLFPFDSFFSDPFTRGSVEDNETVCLGGKLVRDILNEITSSEKTVHRDHSALDVKRRSLAAVSQSVGQAEEAAKGVAIRTEVREKSRGFGRGEAADHLLGQSLVHKEFIVWKNRDGVEATGLAAERAIA